MMKLVILVLLAMLGISTSDLSPAIEAKCQSEVTSLQPCFGYATAVDPTPPPNCCTEISTMRAKDGVCLCYLMEQLLGGTGNSKSLGLDRNRMLNLPSLCNLKNASLSLCPKALNISTSSPMYGIFTNSSTNSSKGNASKTTTGMTDILAASRGYMNQAQFACNVISCMIIAMVLCVIPKWG